MADDEYDESGPERGEEPERPEPRPETQGGVESYLPFLQERFAQTGITRAELAKQMGYARSWATQILNGHRALSPERAEQLAEILPISERERTELIARVEVSQANSAKSREQAQRTLDGLASRAAAESVDADTLYQVANWYVGAIYELARCEGYRADPVWLAATTVYPQITPEEAQRALDTLRRLGLLDDNHQIVPDAPGMSTRHQIDEAELIRAFLDLHRKNAEIVVSSLDEFRWNERHLMGSVVALTDQAYRALCRQLYDAVSNAVFSNEGPSEEVPNRLYRIGLTIFPASLYTDTDYDPSDVT